MLNHRRTELSLDYLKDTKFYLKSKASFVHINSIASFKPFLIAWLLEYCTSSDSSVVSPLVLALAKIHPVWKYFAKTNHVLASNFFPSSSMFFIRLFLANTKKQNRGSTCSLNRKGAFISPSSLV